MKCDWIRYRESREKNMNKRAGMPTIRKRETPASQGICDPLQIPGQ